MTQRQLSALAGATSVGIVSAALGLVALDAVAQTISPDIIATGERLGVMSAAQLLAIGNVTLVAALGYVFHLFERSTQRREAASATFHEKRDEQSQQLMKLVEGSTAHTAQANAVNASLVSVVDKLNSKLDASLVELARIGRRE